MQHQESTIDVAPQITHQRIQSRFQTREKVPLQAALALYSTFKVPFFIILTFIPSTKVAFSRNNKLAKRIKIGGKR
jgi:hypothetical protein